ncbi:MAG: ATP-binding protein [Candidatus Acidiferrum sp.]
MADKKQSKALITYLLSRKKSAGLKANNPFTTAWVLEAVTALEDRYSEPLDGTEKDLVDKKEKILQSQIRAGDGGVTMKPYPPSGYLTQLVVRTLKRRGKLKDLSESVKTWAWAELARQLALIHADSKTQDPFSLAYLLIVVTSLTSSSLINPQQASIQRAALKTFFDCQLKDGTWPLSRPLFHYPDFGNAHCYEYEMLAQLLSEPDLRELLFDYLPNLRAVAEAVSSNVYRVDDKIMVWNSGHHPNQAEPESWATASVYHFFYELDRFLAEVVRRELFRYLESPTPRFSERPKKTESEFAPEVLDSELVVDKQRYPLKKFLWLKFIEPLALEVDKIARGKRFSPNTPRAAIFFGPPGTSKTDLSKKVADFLGWPYLSIDPSRLLRTGLDGIQAEANAIFRMLEWTERVVVLFDEFDELVRERDSSHAEALSRFLTTAMLPKLASIHRRGTLVFILATNNIGEFDLAIRRQGRFDHVIQVMPPTYESKIRKSDWGQSKINIADKLRDLKVEITTDVKNKLGALTFGECQEFASELANVTTATNAKKTLKRRWEHCTLQMHVSKARENKGEITWEKRCKVEAEHNR